jgi:Ca-activated chloride channel homolog
VAITHQLRQGDIVNIVKWANDNNVLLQKYVATGTGADDAVIVDAVNQLSPGGGSDLHGGLVKGYELAGDSFDPNKLNRVVLLSDGGANLGELDRTVIEAAAIQGNGEGIYMVGIGVGPAQGYSDALMDLVTDAGRGAYVYLDSPEEADAVFKGRFDEIMNVAAHDVRVRMDLPEYMQIDDFYGEEYSTDPANIEPQNLAPGDSMVLNQVVYLADPAKACGLDAVNVTVTWKTPLDHQERAVSLPAVTLLELAGAPPSAQMKKANAIIAYAEALRTGDPAELLAALEMVETLEAATGDPDLAEIAALLKMHPAL